jgi:hypothetical protein
MFFKALVPAGDGGSSGCRNRVRPMEEDPVR